ncbi:MAG TPA: hypothetical protein PKC28_05345 [Bdellovibrionales bacterium]|nr:hypothetical protein [Bdellovibrionales bacterium]
MKMKSVLLIAFVALTSCGLKESAEEMKRTSNEIKDHSNHLAVRTDDLERELSKKESHDMLMKQFNVLFGEAESAPPPKDNLAYLLTAAGTAIESMLFQYWKGDFNEDVAILDMRFRLAAEAFFGRVTDHIPYDFSAALCAVCRPDNDYLAVAALGAYLDKLDDNYERSLRERKLPRLSFYDVIVEALRNRESGERVEILPRTAAMVLQWRREATALLQLRHNILPMMALGRITDLQDRGFFGQAWMWLFGQTVSLDKGDREMLKEATVWLRKAEQTRADLRAMGIEPVYNSQFRDLIAGVDFGQAEILASGAKVSKEARDFAETFARVLNESYP